MQQFERSSAGAVQRKYPKFTEEPRGFSSSLPAVRPRKTPVRCGQIAGGILRGCPVCGPARAPAAPGVCSPYWWRRLRPSGGVMRAPLQSIVQIRCRPGILRADSGPSRNPSCRSGAQEGCFRLRGPRICTMDPPRPRYLHDRSVKDQISQGIRPCGGLQPGSRQPAPDRGQAAGQLWIFKPGPATLERHGHTPDCRFPRHVRIAPWHANFFF